MSDAQGAAKKSAAYRVLRYAADREAKRSGTRDLRTSDLTILPGEEGFIFGAAESDGVRAFLFGGKGGNIGVIRVDMPLWELEKQMIGKRCGPFCDIMGIDALCVSCGVAPGLRDVRSKEYNGSFFASAFCDGCADSLKRAWDDRRAVRSFDDRLAGLSGAPDLRVILPREKITKIVFSCRESFESVTDAKTLYYIVNKKIPARLRPSENGAGIIIMKSELRFSNI